MNSWYIFRLTMQEAPCYARVGLGLACLIVAAGSLLLWITGGFGLLDIIVKVVATFFFLLLLGAFCIFLEYLFPLGRSN